jgi:hypothetical protein
MDLLRLWPCGGSGAGKRWLVYQRLTSRNEKAAARRRPLAEGNRTLFPDLAGLDLARPVAGGSGAVLDFGTSPNMTPHLIPSMSDYEASAISGTVELEVRQHGRAWCWKTGYLRTASTMRATCLTCGRSWPEPRSEPEVQVEVVRLVDPCRGLTARSVGQSLSIIVRMQSLQTSARRPAAAFLRAG